MINNRTRLTIKRSGQCAKCCTVPSYPGGNMEQDLFAILPPELSKGPDDYKRYWIWEEKVSTWLKNNGHKIGRWVTTDGDSFGPLVRGIRIDGVLHTYG